MPLSEPSGGGNGAAFGIGSGANMARYTLLNTGADTSVNYVGAQWDDVSNRLIVFGDNGYIGSMASADAALIQAPTLPTIATGYRSATVRDDGAVIVNENNNVYIGDANLDNWSNITPPAAITRRGAFAMRGSNRLYTIEGAVNPEIEFSDDNGLTWSSGAGNLRITGMAQAPTIFAQTRDRSKIAIANGGELAIANGSGDVDTDTWQVSNFNLLLNATTLAWNDAGTECIVGATNGNIVRVNALTGAVTTFTEAENRFKRTSTSGNGPNVVAYIPALSGFLIGANNQEQAVLIPDGSNTMEQGVFIGDTSPTFNFNFGTQPAAVDANGIMIAPASTNLSVIYVPGA